MALAVHVAGPLLIRTDVSGSLADFGYSVNGVNIETVEFRENVPGDRHGGEAGPPIEVIKHPDLHIVSFEMTEWDDTHAGTMDTRIKQGTAGSTVGDTLYRADSKYIRLLLTASGFTRNYIGAIPVGGFQLGPVGSRNSRRKFQFECHPISGVLWNSSTS